MATKARTKEEVDQMSAADRLWDSLNYSYEKKRESQEKAYNKSRSQADRQMLSRGMQRSSYGAQTLANMDQQKNEALDQIWDAQIADYENRLDSAEQRDLDNDRWERQFAEGQRQFNENLAENQRNREWQSGENLANRQWQTEESQKSREWQSGESATQRTWQGEQNLQNQQWQSGENLANRTWQTQENQENRSWQSQENLENRNWQTQENQTNRQWQSEENQTNRNWQSGENSADRALQSSLTAMQISANAKEQQANRDLQASQFDATMAYNRERAAATDAQWDKSYGLQQDQLQFQRDQANQAQSNWQAEYEANQAATKWNQTFQENQANQAQKNTEWSQRFQENESLRQQGNWEKEYAQTQKNADRSYELSKQQLDETHNQNTIANKQWELSYNQNQANNEFNQRMTERQIANAENQQAIANKQWELDYYQNQANNQFNQEMATRQLANAEQQQAIANKQWELSYYQTADQNNWQRDYTERQAAAEQAQRDISNKQWELQYTSGVNQTQQQIATGYVEQALKNGTDISDELLAKAGISRADFNAMKGTSSSSSGSYNPSTKSDPNAEARKNGFQNAAEQAEANAMGYEKSTDYYNAKLNNKLNGSKVQAYPGWDNTPANSPTTIGLGSVKNTLNDKLTASQAQDQIDNLGKQLSKATSNSEREKINAKINELKKKIK